VKVSRIGSGNTTASGVTITQSSDQFVNVDNKGFFKL